MTSQVSNKNNQILLGFVLAVSIIISIPLVMPHASHMDGILHMSIHAVGFVHNGTILDCSSEEFHNSMNINVYSAYLMVNFLIPKMLSNKKGNIIIVSSAASSVTGAPNRFIYATTKAALNGFVKALASDYVKQGIRCNGILPGTVETPSWEGRVNMADDPKKAREDFIARQAMGRLAQPEEIASLAVYLASDESDFVTGTLNLIDGGCLLYTSPSPRDATLSRIPCCG